MCQLVKSNKRLTLFWSDVMAIYSVYFVRTPLTLAGESQVTSIVEEELTTALIPAGISGTEIWTKEFSFML